jgi:hypothetical protein
MVAVASDPLRAAGRVAVVSTFASVASVAAPPVLGLVAESVGARQALLLIVVVLAVATLLSRQVRTEPPSGPVADAPSDPSAATLVETVLADPASTDLVDPDVPGPRAPRERRPELEVMV